MTNKQKALVIVLLMSVLGGATPTIVKIGVTTIPSFSFAFMRFLIAGIIIAPFLLKKNFTQSLKELAPLSILGTINIAFFAVGVKLTMATMGQLLYAAIPLLTAIFLFVLFKERISQRKGFGIIVGFTGVILIALLPIIEKGGQFSGNFTGNILIAIGVASWALYNIYSKSRLKIFSPFIITAAFIWVTCMALFPLFLMDIEMHYGWWKQVSPPAVFAVFYTAIISTIAAFVLNQYVIKLGGPILTSMQFYLIPIFTYISAFFLLGELLTSGLVIGGVLALLGVYIATRE